VDVNVSMGEVKKKGTLPPHTHRNSFHFSRTFSPTDSTLSRNTMKDKYCQV